MMTERKPRAFIGSSREAIPHARAIAAHIEYQVEANAWYAATFEPNDYTMEALDRELDANDFGIFVFAAEDVAAIRNQTYFITRDNTLFEMGLFWGRLGRSRVFCVIPGHVPSGEDGRPMAFHVPSDLEGLNLLRYIDHSREERSILTQTTGNHRMRSLSSCSGFIRTVSGAFSPAGWRGFEMKQRSGRAKLRGFGSVNGRSCAGQAGARSSFGESSGRWSKRDAMTGRLMKVAVSVAHEPQVFVGPSVEGADVEFVEIVRGKVSDRKPSFAK